jgi:hypothetical protein
VVLPDITLHTCDDVRSATACRLAAHPRTAPILALLVGLAALLGAVSYAIVGEGLVGVDDANIYLAYGRNVAAGHGFVYYPGGERVEGFTSLAWMLAAAAAHRLVPASPEQLLFAASVVLVAATWIVLIHGLRTAGVTARMHPLMLALFVAAWCLSTPSYGIWMTTSLMETSLWSFTVCCGVTVFSRLAASDDSRTRWAAGAVAGTAIFVRPEALGIVPLWIATTLVVEYAVHRRIRRAIQAIGPAVVMFAVSAAAITFFRLTYFGYPLPNTYYAKLSPDFLYNLFQGSKYLRDGLYSYPVMLAVFAASAVILALFCLRTFGDSARANDPRLPLLGFGPEVVFATGVIAFAGLPLVTGGDHFPGFRLLQPAWPLFAVPLLYLVSQLSSTSQRAIAGAAVVAASFFTADPNWFGDLHALRREYRIAVTGKRLGDVLNQVAPDGVGTSVGVIAAGGVATTYRGAVVDLMGLNNVRMGHSPGDRVGEKNHAAFSVAVFWELQPDLVAPKLLENDDDLRDSERRMKEHDIHYLRGLLGSSRFRERYRLIVLRRPGTPEYPAVLAYCRVDWFERHARAIAWDDYASTVEGPGERSVRSTSSTPPVRR